MARVGEIRGAGGGSGFSEPASYLQQRPLRASRSNRPSLTLGADDDINFTVVDVLFVISKRQSLPPAQSPAEAIALPAAT